MRLAGFLIGVLYLGDLSLAPERAQSRLGVAAARSRRSGSCA